MKQIVKLKKVFKINFRPFNLLMLKNKRLDIWSKLTIFSKQILLMIILSDIIINYIFLSFVV